MEETKQKHFERMLNYNSIFQCTAGFHSLSHPIELCILSVEVNDQSVKALVQSKLEVAYFHAPSSTI